MDGIRGVISYWKYDSEKYKGESGWVRVESYPVDDDGYPLITPSTGGGDRHEWDKWLFTRDDDGYNAEPIMGRAVTLWCFAGVNLMGLNPPEWTKWISPEFYDELKKMPNWYRFLQDGHSLYLGTMNAAEKVLDEQRLGQIPK